MYTALQEHIEHNRAAVALQLQHVFTGEGVGPWEKQRNAFIQYQAIFSAERAIMGVPRR
ncbi:hypothetical protein D3C75_1277230 [compost metagenome]